MFHVKHEGWERVAHDVGIVQLPAEATARLDRYEALLVELAAPAGMIAPRDVPILHARHVVDSLRAVPHLAGAHAACDMGSGAGLPGVPLAVALPDVHFTLVEVRRNRAAFLERVVRELGLSHVQVYPRRIETLRERFDVCCARAFAPARTAWEAAQPILGASGRLIYWGGASFDPLTDAPDGVGVALFRTTALARSGPLVIMSPQ